MVGLRGERSCRTPAGLRDDTTADVTMTRNCLETVDVRSFSLEPVLTTISARSAGERPFEKKRGVGYIMRLRTSSTVNNIAVIDDLRLSLLTQAVSY